MIWSPERWAELLKQVNAVFDPGTVRLIESDNRPDHDCEYRPCPLSTQPNTRNVAETLQRRPPICYRARKMHDGPEAVASGPSRYSLALDTVSRCISYL